MSHLPGLKLPQTLPRNLTWHAYAMMDFPMTERFVARWLVESYGVDEFLPMLITLACDRLFHLNFEYFDVISMVDKSTEHGKLLFIC